MKQRNILFLLALSIALSGTARADDEAIPLIGLDDDSNPVEVMVTSSALEKQMTQVLSAVHDSTLPVLARQEKTHAKWKLRTFVVGVGASAEIGLGAILKVSAVPRFRLAFSNSKDAALP